ncbi:MAG TPA: hypothetical protein VL096_01345 [Pirellulaceae bacterium]|nr:hypothetical protein [Pirellulaceae bacterium]
MHATLKTARNFGLALAIAWAPALPVRAQQPSSATVDANAESQAGEASYFVSDDDASEFQSVSLTTMQEPAENIAPRETPPRPTTRRGPTGSRQGNIRLASVPNMFGDGFMTSARAVVLETPSGLNRVSGGGFDIPGAGGSRRVKIGENNKALPSDRVYFMYNHFENALSIQEQSLVPPGPNVINQAPIDRYTFGVEKMFFDDLWSCEIRMPFNSSFSAQTENFGVGGGNVGNLAVILKNLLYVDESTSVAAGIGFDMPTGSSANGQIGTMDLNFDND